MNTYAAFHAFIMWSFYVLGCMFVGSLLLFAIAWCWDRWCRRNARKPDIEIKIKVDTRPAVEGLRRASESLEFFKREGDL